MRQLSPFLASHLGFSSLFDELDSLLERGQPKPSYPPFDVYQDEKGAEVKLALAGFKKEDITISHDRKNKILTISSDKIADLDARVPIVRGIGKRAFSLSFRIADDLEATGASLEDGILSLVFTKIVLPENEPHLIAIT
jgi:HSP20 family molecular chaperone IbpA